ncbi:MAG: hypothetical protein B7Z60_03520 [Ferrovum sp. 37-45-19]|jgi:FolB domain-containing protein|nr:MAG: hypothetical protein B7Z65_01590 [Ferrovum sp. 21-44-67]OYV94876.1 MAG: hypothetical protein B7Z60_03520 [Ferrovum sp. 37-45-19]OZB34091.1 MAG: hypothetical protein B7X47_01645 [Ferrovum sp. 34-44-207]HQT80991.1 dihydroneopterin aldolase [Ferrovaceae bacterium]HQU06192.1 dihydroneopterin aldolase [Ferrovaceae bacterium]
MSHYTCTIEDLHATVHLGVHAFEKTGPQDILVNVTLTIPFQAMRKIKQLSDTVDYEPIRDFIQGWSKKEHVELIEHLLHDLVDFCFNDQRVAHVAASIKKTAVFSEVDGVGIGVSTTRSDWQHLQGARETT